MKSVGIITFHGAHNYGSSLQAYALQNTVSALGYDCEIIDFRTEQQKDQYRPLTKRKGFKYILKNAYFLLNYQARAEKYRKFEEFIQNQLKVTDREYADLEALMGADFQFDAYISGSDQIWNNGAQDSSPAYFLPFVKSGKKIAYAPSFGNLGITKGKDDVKKYLETYDMLSVREEAGQKLIRDLTGKEVPILVDPTILLSVQKWKTLIPEKPLISGEYIFFYTLFADEGMIDIGKRLSKLTKMPVVISNISNQYEIFSGFQKKTACGPLDFLNLIQNAVMICTSSFHGTVFSLLLHKPFISMRGMKDNRISTLLKLTGTTQTSITSAEEITEERLQIIKKLDFTHIETRLENERKKGREFLEAALRQENNE